MNRQLAAAERYHAAEQRTGQTVYSFATYVEDLEGDLETFTDEQRRLHLLARLRPELKTALRSMQSLPLSRTDLVTLAARVEDTLRQTSSGRATPRRPNSATSAGHRPRQQNPNIISLGGEGSSPRPRRTSGAQPRRGGGRGRGRGVSNSASNDRTMTADLSHIECYACHKMGHYSTACPDRPVVGAYRRSKNGYP